MKLIEQFNHRLNQSVEVLSESDFKFQNQVDSILRELFQTMNRKSHACIIGGGQCKDFSLPIFVGTFDKTIITDIDSRTVLQTIAHEEKLTFKQVEYTGFEDASFFQDFKESMLKVNDTRMIDAFINDKIQKIEQYIFLKEEVGLMDLVYVSPIYSQLVYQQLLEECNELRQIGFPEHLIKHIESAMLNKMIGIIDRFNNNLIKLLHNEGYLLVLSDIFELQNGSEFYLNVSNKIGSKEAMEELHRNYVSQYGMGLGDYGLYNLDNNMIEIKSKWLLWPFSNQKSYAVKLKTYKKNDIEGGIL